MLIGWVRPLFDNTCLCHFIFVMEIVLWHWPPLDLQCHMIYDPLHAAVSLQIAHPRYLISTSTCSWYQIQWLPARCVVTIYSVFTSLLLLFSALRANNNFVSNSWLRYVRHFSGEFSPKSQPQHTVSWSDPRLVVVRLLDCLIDCVLHSYRSHHYSLVTPRDSVTVSGAGSGSRVTCHVARNL